MIETRTAPPGYEPLAIATRLEETAAVFDGPPEGRLISFGAGT